MQNIGRCCSYSKIVDNAQQCFAFTPQANFPDYIWLFTAGEGDEIKYRLSLYMGTKIIFKIENCSGCDLAPFFLEIWGQNEHLSEIQPPLICFRTGWIFFQIFWSSHNIWTLLKNSKKSAKSFPQWYSL